MKWVYSHVDTAIAVGSNSRDYFIWCGLPPDRIAFAPHSVDAARFAGDDAEHEQRAAQWRVDLGIAPGEVVFLYAGKLQPKKDPLLLLDAFRALTFPCHLVYVGSGELEEQLKARAAGLDNVHFLTFQNQRLMPTVYRIGDLFVLPSRGPGETWGLALNEAMAGGRALLASSKVGGARDLIRPGENGWIFESGNRDSLQAFLERACRQGRDGLRAMGSVSRSFAAGWSNAESARGIARAVLQACTPDVSEIRASADIHRMRGSHPGKH